MEFKLSEMFVSFQGEAQLVGRRSLFVRFAYCNLACSFCDTPQRNAISQTPTLKDIQQTVREEQISHIVITGGEPTLYLDEVYLLIKGLPDCTFEIETNGLRRIPEDILQRENVYVNISPKVDFADRYELGSLPAGPRIIYKFPLNQTYGQKTIDFINVHALPKKKVYFMPMSKNYLEYTQNIDYVLQQATEFKVNVSPRLHLHYYIK